VTAPSVAIINDRRLAPDQPLKFAVEARLPQYEPGISAEWSLAVQAGRKAFLRTSFLASLAHGDSNPEPSSHEQSGGTAATHRVSYVLAHSGTSGSPDELLPLFSRRFALTDQTSSIGLSDGEVELIYGNYGDLSSVRTGVLTLGTSNFLFEHLNRPVALDVSVSEPDIDSTADFFMVPMSKPSSWQAGPSSIMPSSGLDLFLNVRQSWADPTASLVPTTLFLSELGYEPAGTPEPRTLQASDLDDSEPPNRVLISLGQLDLGPSVMRRCRTEIE
jgi:hypothetical protein